MAHTVSSARERSKAASIAPKMLGSPDEQLASQYGGNSSVGWLGILPLTWLPYVQLARLSPPAGLCLIYFPHLFGLLHASILEHRDPAAVTRAGLILLGGSFFVSNTIHIWNDLIDAPLDAQVRRTRNRPIPRGAISSRAALIFTVTQAIGAALFLPPLFSPVSINAPVGLTGLLYALPGMAAWTYYPWAKRHTNFPQLVLGFCLAWGIFMGELAAGGRALLDSSSSSSSSSSTVTTTTGGGNVESGGWRRSWVVNWSALCLFAACVLWAVIYDTVYAQQDMEDDIKAGIKSLAVRFRGRTKQLLTLVLLVMAVLLGLCGLLSPMGPAYYLFAAGGATLSLALMIVRVDLKSSANCWMWFSQGFWLAGGSITGGLLAEYVLERCFGQHYW